MAHPGIFTAQPLMLAGPGFPEFGAAHLAWLAACLAWIRASTARFRALSGTRRRRFLRMMACIPLALLASEDALMIASGTFSAPWWPLHFCNFAEYICLAYAIHPSRACRELLLMLGLPGGACAMLFPGWAYCPAYTWPVVCGFSEHATIFAISLMALSDARELPCWRDMPVSLAFVGCYVAFFRWFNARMGTNFGFVTQPAAGSPLHWWADAFGNPGYLVPYALAFLAGCAIMHGACARRHARAVRAGAAREG